MELELVQIDAHSLLNCSLNPSLPALDLTGPCNSSLENRAASSSTQNSSAKLKFLMINPDPTTLDPICRFDMVGHRVLTCLHAIQLLQKVMGPSFRPSSSDSVE
jgi:hypothetical protein